MKTTLKKTMAALSAAAVVAASAAVMAVPASAADQTITAGTVTLTLSELKAANYEVTVPVSASADLSAVDFGMKLADGLTYVDAGSSTKASAAAAHANGFVWMPYSYGSADMSNIKAGQIAYLTVTVTEDAKAGDEFAITVTNENAKGVHTTAGHFDADGKLVTDEFTPVAGAIIIAEDPTEAPTTTTEAPTTTEAEATTTAAAKTTAATTAKVATATTKKATSTSSPKTGDALPVAGVAVAVAVIGGVALVSKKRK